MRFSMIYADYMYEGSDRLKIYVTTSLVYYFFIFIEYRYLLMNTPHSVSVFKVEVQCF